MNKFDVKTGFILLLAGAMYAAAASGAPATEFTPEQRLGRLLYTDTDLSLKRNQSCESCHSLKREKVFTEVRPGIFKLRRQSSVSFADPDNLQSGSAVADGSVAGKFGTLNTPSAGYAAFSPFASVQMP